MTSLFMAAVAVAFFAMPATVGYANICGCKFMSSFAVGLCAADLRGCLTGKELTSSSPCIFCTGYDFQMHRVDAAVNKAQMVDCHPIWYWSAKEFIGEPMCSYVFTVNLKASVLGMVHASEPEPAASVWLWGNKVHEPVEKRSNRGSHTFPPETIWLGAARRSNAVAALFDYKAVLA